MEFSGHPWWGRPERTTKLLTVSPEEAATTSNSVLKHIIQEKNRTIQRYQKKIEIMRQSKFLDHNSDRRARTNRAGHQ